MKNTLFGIMDEIRNNFYWFTAIDMENVLIDIHFYHWGKDGWREISETLEYDNFKEFETAVENDDSFKETVFHDFDYLKNDESGLVDYLTIWVG